MKSECDQHEEAEETHPAHGQYVVGVQQLALSDDGRDPRRLWEAIRCFEAAVRGLSETDHHLLRAHAWRNLAYARWRTTGAGRRAELVAAKECAERALDVFTEADHPHARAETQNTLGLILSDWELPGDRDAGLRRALVCLEEASRLWSACAERWDWAMVQNNLGRVWAETSSPDRCADLARAVACYEGALTVVDRGEDGPYWAMVQNNLGNALFTLSGAEPRRKDEHLRRALECYLHALEIHTEADYARDWALAQSNLAGVYLALDGGRREDHQRAAITCYEASLRVYTEEAQPFQWARVQDNLGIAYRDFVAGDRAANLARAVACHEAALRFYREDTHPHKWAQAQVNLGITHRATSPTDDPDRPGRLAREAFTAVLRFYTETEHPLPRANALSDLARAWQTRRVGDRQENLCTAIGHFEESLRLREAVGAPDHGWAWTRIGLGHCHRDLPASGVEHARSLVRAIDHYAAGLRVFLQTGSARECAMTHNLLGRAYHSLAGVKVEAEDLSSDREENLRLAVASYRAALDFYREQGRDALTWATIQCNLAKCFSSLKTGLQRENLARAQACFEAALRVRTRRAHPREWANTYWEMGVSSLSRRGWDRREGAVRAAGFFQKALTVYKRTTYPEAWAGLQTLLGRAYVGWSALGENRLGLLQRAARRFRAALSYFTPAEHSLSWAWAHRHLADACRALAGLTAERRSETRLQRKAAASYRTALTVYTPEQYPAMHAGLTRDLAAADAACRKRPRSSPPLRPRSRHPWRRAG